MRKFQPQTFNAGILPLMLLACAFGVQAQVQRVPNTSLTMPAAPPVQDYTVTNAFGALNFFDPVGIVSPPGETNRLFVIEHFGNIAVITNLAAPNRTVFLSISNKVTYSDEGGLLGLAFHPGFASNGLFYVWYYGPDSTAAGTGPHDILAQYQVSPPTTNFASAATEVKLIRQYDEANNHNAGDLHFGADGYLYVSLGDEGGANGQYGNDQRIDRDLFSGIIRIDVDKRPGSLPPNPHPAATTNYAVPPDNPFIGITSYNGTNVNPANVRTEFWAVGLRNPWRFSFDPPTGLLYAADLGQDAQEEVDVITKGGNYGWGFREGLVPGPRSNSMPAGFSSTPPILAYGHGFATNQGYCIIGGLVYRGSNFPQLAGAYVFGDNVSGNIWSLMYDGTNATSWRQIASAVGLSTFGTDPRNGDILLAARDVEGGVNTTQPLKRLIYSTNSTGAALPPTLANTGAFSDLASLTPNAGIVPYDINVPFWSDDASKTRWFSVPKTNLTIGFNATNNWTFPTGTVWIKHFELQLTNGAAPRRIETRLLVKNANGVYGVTYRWGGATTNATLVGETGLDENFVIDDGGGVVRTQTWHYPGRQECLSCHTPSGGLSLGFNTSQLNRDFTYGGGTTNQIQALSGAGYFGTPAGGTGTWPALVAATDSSASDEVRVRSYLAANCAQCHQPGGSARGLWDGRFTVPEAQAGIINGALVNNQGDSNNVVVKPGFPANSVLLSRVANLGPGHMPPLATTVVNAQAVALLNDWITNELPASPAISLNPSIINFVAVQGSNPPDQSLGITNVAGGILNWTAVADATAPAWLVLSPTNGIGDGMLTVSVVSAGLAGGNYSKNIAILAPGAINNPQSATVNLRVDRAPVAQNDNYSVPTDGTLTAPAPGVLANDADADGDVLVAAWLGGPAHGTLNLGTNGSFSYVPTAGYSGVDTFTYSASDGIANSPAATVTITVATVIQPPLAGNDGYSIAAGATLNVSDPGVLGNDVDTNGYSLSAVWLGGPAHGTLNLNANGSFSYVPAAGYSGMDAFTYAAGNGATNSSPATVSITVTPVNLPPVANNDSYSTAAGVVLTVTAPGVLANDTDPEGKVLTAGWLAGPAHGTLGLNANGTFTYTPTNGYNGPDSFTYKANDGTNDSPAATVSLTITAPVGILFSDNFTRATDPGPIAPWLLNAGTWTATGGVMHGSSPLNNYGYAYLNTNWTDYSVQARVQFPAGAYGGGIGGRVILSSGAQYGAWIYPEGSAGGSSVLKLTKDRTWTTWSGTPMQQVSLASVGTNWHTLKMTMQSNHIQVFYDGTPMIDLLDTGFDSRAAYLTGGISLDLWTYSKAFTMNVDDVLVTPIGNQPPVANSDSYSVSAGTILNVGAPGVLANDSDPDGNSLTAVLVGGPAHGTLNLGTNGSFTYTTAAGYSGPDSFSYRASDGTSSSTTATAGITVIPVNNPPVANSDSYSVSAGTTLNVSAPGVLANDSDPNGNPMTAVWVSGPAHGMLNLSTNGSFSYTPAAGYSGPDSFSYRAYDGITNSAVATASITVIPVNNPPVANNDSYSVSAGTTLNVSAPGVLANDSDPNGNPMTAVWVSGPAHGTLNLSTNGSFSYTPAAGYSGPDSFSYRAYDGITNSAVATASITVIPVNNPPVANSDSYSVSAGTTLNVSAPGVLANDSDPNGNPMTAVWISGPAHGTLNLSANGSFSYTPAAGYSGPDSFSYRAYDGITNSTAATASITVVPVNQPPVATNDSFSVTSGGILNVSAPGVLTNDVDPNGNPLTAVWLSGPTNGTLTLSTNGAFVYTPTPGYVGPDGFNYMANDGLSNSSPAMVSLGVLPVNHPPVATNDSYNLAAGSVLNVAAPGVLANDFDSDGNPIIALTLAGPAHGILSLNTNGSFTYTPASNYSGADSFTYMANDRTNDSAAATVSLTINPVNHPPVAANDAYTITAGSTLTVTAPGVLTNDIDSDGNPLIALWLGGPAHGTLNLNTNGAFSYTPASNYSGPDSFTYKANDRTNDSAAATVNLTVTTNSGILFSDNFTRGTDPGPISPWLLNAGTWTATGGVMRGFSPLMNYGYAYLNTNWTDYSVQARVQFPAGAYGGGIGGRVILSSGAQYGAWIYPEGSAGGSSVLKLTKDRTWTTWSGTPMQQVSLASVGTNWHTLKMTMQSNHIQVSYDGTLMIDLYDTGFDARAAYLTGSVSLDLWTYTKAFTMNVDDVIVTPIASQSQASGFSAPSGMVATKPAAGMFNSFSPTLVIDQSLIGAPDAAVIFSWPAIKGHTYRIQYKDALNAAGWNDLAPDITATADTVFFTNHPAAASMRYYRIMVLPAAR